MPYRSSKHVTVGSGNGNAPRMNVKLAFCQIDIHIHDVMSIFKLIIGAAALIYWLKTTSVKEKTE